jgi:hypothetical protein
LAKARLPLLDRAAEVRSHQFEQRQVLGDLPKRMQRHAARSQSRLSRQLSLPFPVFRETARLHALLRCQLNVWLRVRAWGPPQWQHSSRQHHCGNHSH